ncbi:MAG: sulfatase, partial [Nanoarchaeota archaeon]
GPTPSPDKHNIKSIRTETWKLIYNETTNKKELYNLEKDPEETVNLAGTEPELENYLWESLKAHQE